MADKYSIKVGVEFDKSDIKSKLEQALSIAGKNTKIKLDFDLSNLSNLSKVINSATSDMQSKFNEMANGSKSAFQGIESQLDSMATKIKNSFDFRNLNNIDSSKVSNLSKQLEMVANGANVSKEDISKLKQEINDLGKSDSQIARIQQTINSLKTNINKLETKGKLDILSDSELSQLKQCKSELTNLEILITKISSQVSLGNATLTSKLNNAKNSVKDLNNSLQSTSTTTSTLRTNVQSLMTAIVGSSGIYLVVGQVKELLSTITELDSRLIDLTRVSNLQGDSLKNFGVTANQLAQDLNSTTSDILKLGYETSKLGLDIEGSGQEFLKFSQILSNVGDIDVTSAMDAMTSITKGFGMNADEAERITDVLDNLGNKYAISAGNIAEAFKSSAANLNLSNTSLEQSAALITSSYEILQNDTRVGNGLKTISLRVQNYAEDLKKLGLQVYDTEGNVRSLYDIMLDASKLYNSMSSDSERYTLLEKLGGKQQVTKCFVCREICIGH